MYRQLKPLTSSYPKSTWLTVGDGRYGSDANYLISLGLNALATDINATYLRLAKEDGFISAYAVENAEKLSFQDSSFDFVLCKESYHHFPRPMLALYEMLRVSKVGVILIEPNDQNLIEPHRTGIRSSAFWFLFSIKQWIKRKLGRPQMQTSHRYETIGNYVYSISRRELEKVALGMNLNAIAFKGLNDDYLEGVEYEALAMDGPLFQKINASIERLDERSRRRPECYGLLAAMIFKELPSEQCLSALRQNQFEVMLLEKNPYINP